MKGKKRMTEFEESNWSDRDFSNKYLDDVDIFIPERKKLIEILESFYHHFMDGKSPLMMLDLGCGDGILTYRLKNIDQRISATLIDGSGEMLKKARERLAGFKNINIIKASFQDLIDRKVKFPENDFTVSSLAIHHLDLAEKKSLYTLIYSGLKSAGYFINIDVVLPPSKELDGWYHQMWENQIIKTQKELGKEESYEYIVKLYQENPENKPDTLNTQLKALTDIGFKEVDCYYKNGIYTVFGGQK